MDPSQQPPQQPQPPQTPPQTPPAGFQPMPDPSQPQPHPGHGTPQQIDPAQAMYGQPQQPSMSSYVDDLTGPFAASKIPTAQTNNWLIWGIIAAIVILGSFLMFFIINSRPDANQKMTEAFLRMQTLKTVSEKQHKHLRDNQLRVSNRNMIAGLTNAITDIEAPLTAAGMDKKKISEKTTATESKLLSDLTEKFEDALLNITLDRVYTREMALQLGTLQAMMSSAYANTTNKDMRTYLETTSKNLSPVARSFSEFSVTK